MADNWQLKAVLSANAESMLKALKSVNAATKDTRKYLADVAKSAGNLSGKLGLPFAAISAAAGGLSVMAVKNSVLGLTDMAEAAQKGALKAGMSVEQWQRMKYVAEQSGTPIDVLEGSLSKLNRTVGDAAAGKNQTLAALMQRLGINTRDANGQVRAGVDLLPQLADAFKKNENPAVRARMGMALFGKSYAEILPLLAEGSEGIDQNLKRFDKIKGVLGAGEIKAAKDLGDSFKDLELVMKGFQGVVAKQLVPVIKPLVDGLVEWWVANKKLVSVEVAKMAKELADYIKTIDFKAVLQGVGDFFRSLSKLVDMVGGAKNALIGLVVFMNLQSIIAFGSLALAVGKVIWSLGVMAVGAIPPALAGIRSLTLAMAISNSGGLAMLGTVGSLIGKLGLLAAAATAGYAAGSWLYDKAIAGTDFGDAIGSGVAHTMAFFGNDEAKAAIASNERTSLVGTQSKGRVDGQVNIKIDGLPMGSRVDQSSSGGMPMNLDVGMRSYATGMPY